MSRKLGTISMGVRCPIIKEGDDLCSIVVNSIMEACEEENIKLHDRDIVAVTESVVARAQGNYATVSQIATDIKNNMVKKLA